MSYFARLREYARRGTGEAVAAQGLSMDWEALLVRVEQGASGLVAAGIGPGSVVGITIADEVEHFVACLALLRVGAWQIALATHDPEPERRAIAVRAGVTHVLNAGEHSLAGAQYLSWPPTLGDALAVGHAEGGVMLRTSGTTGTMNIVPLSAGELLVQADRNREYAGGRGQLEVPGRPKLGDRLRQWREVSPHTRVVVGYGAQDGNDEGAAAEIAQCVTGAEVERVALDGVEVKHNFLYKLSVAGFLPAFMADRLGLSG